MAKILLIETATETCSVAISADGVLCSVVEDLQASSHAALLTLQIEQCVRESGIALAELDAVALSAGPGSYTSLRVGASVAKGICYALDKPLLAIDTLQALAYGSRQQALADQWIEAGEDFLLMPMIDARRQEVWTAVYQPDLEVCLSAQALILENNSFENLLSGLPNSAQIKKIIISGNGGIKLNSDEIENITVTHSKILKCSAVHLQQLAALQYAAGNFVDIAYFFPFYMKAPNITVPKSKL